MWKEVIVYSNFELMTHFSIMSALCSEVQCSELHCLVVVRQLLKSGTRVAPGANRAGLRQGYFRVDDSIFDNVSPVQRSVMQ